MKENSTQTPEPLKEIRAERIVLVDETGRQRAVLQVTSPDDTAFSLYDGKGHLRLTLRANELESTVNIFSEVENSSTDETYSERVIVGYQPEDGSRNINPRVSLFDRTGDENVRIDQGGIRKLYQGLTHVNDPDFQTGSDVQLRSRWTEERIIEAVDEILSIGDDLGSDTFCQLLYAISVAREPVRSSIIYEAMRYAFTKTRHFHNAMDALGEKAIGTVKSDD